MRSKSDRESDELNEVRVGKKVGDWIQPTNRVMINYFFKNRIIK